VSAVPTRGAGVWRALRPALVLAVTVLSLSYFGRELLRYWDSLAALAWSRQLLLLAGLALLLQVASSLLDGWSWQWILAGLRVPASTRQAVCIFGLAQFAKYLPGNVAQHVGRVVLARQAGWRTERVALSLFLENVFALGCGGLLALLGFLLAGEPAPGGSRLLGGALLVVAGGGLVVLALRRVLARPRPWLGLTEPLPLSGTLLSGYFLVHLASFLVMGGTLVLLLWGLAGQLPPGVWRLPAAVALAWLAGYLVPGAPAGLGVREATFTAYLSPHLDPGVVLSAALLWRGVSLGADALLALLGLALRPAP
jgi:glycosyltransferase 2 family protein